MKFNDILTKTVTRDLESNTIPMLLGEPGIGKSSWVNSLAEHMHTKVFVLQCNLLADKADATGARLVPTADGKSYEQVFYPHATIARAIKYAEDNPRETPILFMDEINRTPSDVTSALLSIPTARTIGNADLPKNLKVIAAGNDKGNVTSLDSASRTRFDLIHVTPDVTTYLALDDELNPFIRKVLESHPETIYCTTIKVVTDAQDDDGNDVDGDISIDEILDDEEDMEQIATPRTITQLSKWLNLYSNDELIELITNTHVEKGEEVSDLEELLRGKTGNTSFTKYLLAVIAENINKVSTQSNAFTVPKPQCYDDMKTKSDMTELEDFVSNMTESERSGCLVYALYEKADNAPFIRTLAQHLDKLENNDSRMLATMYSKDILDEDNRQALLDTGTDLANALSIFLA